MLVVYPAMILDVRAEKKTDGHIKGMMENQDLVSIVRAEKRPNKPRKIANMVSHESPRSNAEEDENYFSDKIMIPFYISVAVCLVWVLVLVMSIIFSCCRLICKSVFPIKFFWAQRIHPEMGLS